MNTRIKKLRKTLDLTQADFAARIGTSANVLTNYETGRRNPSKSVVNNICKTFSVNETWLRTGEGEMFLKVSREEEIAAFVERVLVDESADFKRRFIAALSKLSPEGWDALEQLVEDISRQHTAADRAALEREADEFAALAREQYLSEKIRASQASSAKESGAG